MAIFINLMTSYLTWTTLYIYIREFGSHLAEARFCGPLQSNNVNYHRDLFNLLMSFQGQSKFHCSQHVQKKGFDRDIRHCSRDVFFRCVIQSHMALHNLTMAGLIIHNLIDVTDVIAMQHLRRMLCS